MNFLCIDVGTTCCKCQLWTQKGLMLFYDAREIALKKTKDGQFVNIESIVLYVKEVIKKVSSFGKINSIAFSSLGESFVLLDENDNLLSLPMLYTDNRGKEQAERVAQKFSKDKIFNITGTVPHSMFSIYKLLWIKENLKDVYLKADKLMLVGEYLAYLLTGERVIDYGLASRTGVFDVKNKDFSRELLGELDVSIKLFSSPRKTGSIVGSVKKSIALELGLVADCKVVLGSHDQICATVGAGVINSGDAGDGMGTVECITAVYDNFPTDTNMGEMGYTVVPFFDRYCTYILNFTSGSIVGWLKKEIVHDFCGEEKDFYEYAQKDALNRKTELLLLPYFAGSATPYQDGEIKGALLGLTLETTDRDIYRAILEATSMEMRLNLETVKQFDIDLKNLVATGGGAKSDAWLSVKSNVLKSKVKRLASLEGGLCGLAIIQAVAMGTSENYEQAINLFVKYEKEFIPCEEEFAYYDKKYEKYKKLYCAIKSVQ